MDTTSKGILPKTTITKDALYELIKKWEREAALCHWLIPYETGDMLTTTIARRNQLFSCIADLNTLLATT